jgi:hypothetical protein
MLEVNNIVGSIPSAKIFGHSTQTVNIIEVKNDDATGTSYLEMDSSGNMVGYQDHWFSGDGSGLPYGHMYSNTTITVAVAVATTAYEVNTIGTDFTTGELNLVTFSDHYLAVTKAGRYLINWSMSTAQNAPGAAIVLEGGVMVGGTAQNQGVASRALPNATDVGNFGSCCILDLAASDQVSLYIKNQTNTTNIDVENANLTVIQVGGT